MRLREPADAAARAADLVEELRTWWPPYGAVVHDLGSGSGSMTRWLAPLLPGPQRWVLHDRDEELLALARADPPPTASDGASVTVESRTGDLTRLDPRVLADADLVTASALLDMLTAEELNRLLARCVGAGCPVLLTLSVVGRVSLDPAEALDPRVMGAFNDHQRRVTGAGRLLGPDAAAAAVTILRATGMRVLRRDSPWRLGAAETTLIEEWFAGWLDAAGEQDPELLADTAVYRERRLADLAVGSLRVTVHHEDLLALPPRPGR